MQELPTGNAIPRDGGDIVAPGDAIDFEADELRYDDNTSVVTAIGGVKLARDAWKLSADGIEYNRTSGVVVATGNVVSIDPEGNQAFGDRIELTDSLKDGAIAKAFAVESHPLVYDALILRVDQNTAAIQPNSIDRLDIQGGAVL